MQFRTLTLMLSIMATHAQTNVLDNLVATFTGGNTERASDLLDTLEGCGTPDASTNLFQDILVKSLNSTRTCFSLESDRSNARKCVDRSTDALRLATSPYDTFSVQALSTNDIATLYSCGEGTFATDDDILNAFKVLTKRFLQCKVTSYTPDQKKAILDVFKGDSQQQEVSRAQLASVCSSLHFSGELHKDLVNFMHQTLKHFVVLIPSRR